MMKETVKAFAGRRREPADGRWVQGLGFIMILFLLLPTSAQAFDVWAFISVGGQALPGDTSQSNLLKRGGIQVSSIGSGLTREVNPVSGTPGPPSKRPFSMTKPVDVASPILFQAMSTGAGIDAEFRFFRVDAAGQEEHFYTVQISSGVLTQMLQSGGFTDAVESIQIEFQQITHVSVTGGTSGSF